MDNPTSVHSTPLDSTKTSKVRNHVSALKQQSGTLFSLRDKLRSLRRKSTPSSSATHRVTLKGLKSASQTRDSTPADSSQNRSQGSEDLVFGTAFGIVRSGWLRPQTSASFCHC